MTRPQTADVELRRLLRPAAWTVWTAVVAHAERREDGDLFAAVSVRGLAVELGLAKDTVAGCVQRLTRHGLVERCPQAHVQGRFIRGGYLVYPPGVDGAVTAAAPIDRPPQEPPATALDMRSVTSADVRDCATSPPSLSLLSDPSADDEHGDALTSTARSSWPAQQSTEPVAQLSLLGDWS